MDRFHFKAHRDHYCAQNNNPDTIAILDNVNTSVCEQTNYWFSGYKFLLKHMNYERFNFTIFVLLYTFFKILM